MVLWHCDYEDCGRPAVRNLGDCILCNRHLCAAHLEPEFHKCPQWADADKYDPEAQKAEERELNELIEKIDTKALEARCSQLRQGMACSVPKLQYDSESRSSVMGGMNYHIDVQFEDGTIWVARIRRFNATAPPAALRDYIIQSEVATLKFREKTDVPAPRVFDHGLEHPDNAVGVGFILMEKLPGSSLRWSTATKQQRRKVMDQIANIFIELQKYPFQMIGSLNSPEESHVGAFAQESLTDFDRTGMHTAGPFFSTKEYHYSSIQLILDLILRQGIYSQQAADAYLIHRFLLDLIPTMLPAEDSTFYVKHADDKGDHILVDEEFNVTGIIDWEWAHTVAPAIAFNSPIGFLPVSDFYNSKNDLGEDENAFADLLEEKGHKDLAQHVWKGRLQHRFAFCCGHTLTDWDGFLGLFRGLRDAVGVDEGVDWNDWKRTALKRYQEDPGLQSLLKQ